MSNMYRLDLGGANIGVLSNCKGLDDLLPDMAEAFKNELPKDVRISLHKEKYKRTLWLAASKPVPDFALLFNHALNEQIRVCMENAR